jgi:penicillin-binding protein 1C
VDNATKKPLCSNKKAKNSYIEVYEYWSTDILDIFKKAGLPKRNPPDMSHCDSLNMTSFGIAPFITSPLKNTTYAIRANRDDKNKIVFSATADASVGMLYWFFDDEFIGSTEPLSSLDFVPKKAGKFNISVIDDHGRVDKRDINIIFTN